MIKFNRNKHWVTFKKDDEEAKFLIRYTLPKVIREQSYDKISDTNITYGVIEDLMIDNVVDWKGILDDDGKEKKCTKENKIEFFSENLDMKDFIQNEMNKLSEKYNQLKEEIKN